MQPGQRIARIGGAHDSDDLLVVDQLVHVLDRLRRSGGIVADHRHHLAPENAALGVQVLDGGLEAITARQAEFGGAGGRLVGIVADLDLSLLGEGQRWEHGRAGQQAAKQAAGDCMRHAVSS